MNKKNITGLMTLAVASSILVSSCIRDKRSPGWEYAPNMYEALAYNPDQKNPIFKDGKSAQLPPAGTTPVGFVRFEYPNNKAGYELAGGEVKNPLALNTANLKDGKMLYKSFCSPCHGLTGKGDGLVVEHGYPPPPSYATGNSSRGGSMKDLTDGKIYHTIQYGVNAMGSYASQLSPDERWKVVMYVHQLQLGKP